MSCCRFISLGALLFGREEKSKEGLSFLDGSYFCFISLSTIGFGDIVPPMDPSEYFELNFILCSIYLMLGMALIAMCFNLMQQDVVQKIRTCTDIVRRIARCRRWELWMKLCQVSKTAAFYMHIDGYWAFFWEDLMKNKCIVLI